MRRSQRARRRLLAVGLAIWTGVGGAVSAFPAATLAATILPSGFNETIAFSGLVQPTVVAFANDGRIFVAEKSGLIKVFSNLSDTTATTFADLRTNVHNFWDRGLLGMALAPNFPTNPSVYVLYTYDHILGDGAPAPRWGTAGGTTDPCPTPPGATGDGCVVSARLSRLTASGDVVSGPEQVLIEDWCQQYPSHSIGTLAFGSDGFLYASGGDGASFIFADHGQDGSPLNPCGDPPVGVGGTQVPPSAEGGALRSQDVRTGPRYEHAILRDRPVAWWRLGETSGAARDAIGGRSATPVGTVTRGVTGGLVADTDRAISLAGAGYLTVPTDAQLNFGNGPLSWELWVRRTVFGTEQVLVSQTGAGTPAIAFGDDNRFGLGKSGVVWVARDSGQVTDSNWHHFVVTRDAAGLTRIYRDGANVTSEEVSTTLLAPTGPTEIGREAEFAAGNAHGDIDEVALYRRVLTPAEVADHFARGRNTAALPADPTGLDGTIIRIDPATGAAAATNPRAWSSDANARRIIASGFRNPFRFTFRPGTSELWVGDVGWNTWEDIHRIPAGGSTVVNAGWPCHEGSPRQAAYDAADLTLCETLYAGAEPVQAPHFAYRHDSRVTPNEVCPIGSSSIAGLAFYTGGAYPDRYDGALFFLDYSRDCIWAMLPGAGGQPDPAQIELFAATAGNPVNLTVGPGGDLFYPDFDGGVIRRIQFTSGNQPPVSSFTAVPTNGPAPLTVQFDGTASSDPEGGALTYAWDLDGDGSFDDATGATASFTYQAGTYTVRLRVTDPGGATGTASRTITSANTAPVAVIDTPTTALRWAVGETVSFSGHGTDEQDGTIPASAMTWSLAIQHCSPDGSTCHRHPVQDFPDVASGSFVAPDHEFPSYLELTLTVTDSGGLNGSTTLRLDPRTVVLHFATQPSGLQLAVGSTSSTAPFDREVIVGSQVSVTAATPQVIGSTQYDFGSWSDGGSRTHTITATGEATYTATFTAGSVQTFLPVADAEVRLNKENTNYGTLTTMRVRTGNGALRSYLRFNVTGLTGAPTSARLRLWVTDAALASRSLYAISNTTWGETTITWNNAPALPASALAPVPATTSGAWVEVDLGNVITGNGLYSFAISGGSNDIVTFSTRESANDPQLVLTTG